MLSGMQWLDASLFGLILSAGTMLAHALHHAALRGLRRAARRPASAGQAGRTCSTWPTWRSRSTPSWAAATTRWRRARAGPA